MKLLGQMTASHIYRNHSLPRGIDVFQDIVNFLPVFRADIVFDIGANVGQSSKLYLANFPSSHIYCFEPVTDTFRQLQDNLSGNERVDCYRLALGSGKGKGKMVLQGSCVDFFLLDQSKASPRGNGVATESVDIVTIDEFCQMKAIDYINYLKVDTEGGTSTF